MHCQKQVPALVKSSINMHENGSCIYAQNPLRILQSYIVEQTINSYIWKLEKAAIHAAFPRGHGKGHICT